MNQYLLLVLSAASFALFVASTHAEEPTLACSKFAQESQIDVEYVAKSKTMTDRFFDLGNIGRGSAALPHFQYERRKFSMALNHGVLTVTSRSPQINVSYDLKHLTIERLDAQHGTAAIIDCNKDPNYCVDGSSTQAKNIGDYSVRAVQKAFADPAISYYQNDFRFDILPISDIRLKAEGEMDAAICLNAVLSAFSHKIMPDIGNKHSSPTKLTELYANATASDRNGTYDLLTAEPSHETAAGGGAQTFLEPAPEKNSLPTGVMSGELY